MSKKDPAPGGDPALHSSEGAGPAEAGSGPSPAAAAPAGPAAGAAEEPKVLKDEIAAKERLARGYFDQLLRLKADFENFRKRVDREKPEMIRYGRSEILMKLLPLFDVLAQAHEEVLRQHAAGGGTEGVPEGLKSLAKGMELIFKEFEKLFDSEGIRPIEAQGKPYNHEWHDVVGTVERADLEEGTVVEVLQPGFTMDGKVLRHAKVRISRKAAAPGGGPKENVPDPA